MSLFAAGAAFGQSVAAPDEMKERTNLRNVRYCEVLVVDRQLKSTWAKVYNTIGLNDCPADKWNALDAKSLKKERGATAVILNGPRYFVMDRNALRRPGEVDHFDGLDMRLLAILEIKDMAKRVPYTENTVQRESQYLYERGKYVYELISPQGKTYVMQSYSVEVDKSLNEDGLLKLSSRLKLPKGWQYRARKVDEDFAVSNTGSQAFVVQDDLRNSYQRLQ
jgi:hypothetical protein